MTLEELEIVVKANVEEATAKLEALKAQMEGSTAEGFKEITKEADKMGDAMSINSENIEKMVPELVNLTTKTATGSTAMAGFSKAIATASTAIKTAFPILLAISIVIMAIVKAINSFNEKVEKTLNTIKQISRAVLDKILKQLQKVYNLAIKLIGVLSNLAKNGISNLVQVSGELNNVLSQIQGKTIQLGNALASAVAPIIQALTPLILELLNAIINVANMIGEITASLFGNATTFKKATNVTTDYAKSLGKANKEQQKMLAGFDELNVLSDKQSSDNGLITAVQDMFEPTEIRKEIQDLSKKIREVFAEAKLQIDLGDFEGAGDTIGQAFNSMVEKLPTEQWGRNIADKMNKALELVNGFLKNNPAGTIGKKLGQFIKGWIEKISSTEIGQAIANVINNAFSFVGNFFGSLNENQSLLKLGKKLASNLKAMIEGLNSAEIANAIAQTVLGLADLAIGFFGDWIFNGGLASLIKKIHEMLSNIPWKEVLPKVIEAIATAWLAINATKLYLKNLIMLEILSWLAGTLKEKIVEGVKGIWNSIFNTADENGVTLLDKLKEIWNKISSWFTKNVTNKIKTSFESIGKNMNSNIKDVFNGIIDVVERAINRIISKINTLRWDIPDWVPRNWWSNLWV